MAIKVINRSTGNVCYELPELNVRRVFNIGESKIIDEAELEMVSQQDGGLILLQDFLLVDNKEWVAAHWDAPIEYWWLPERIRKSMIEDDLELFSETLDYAPEGVIDFIKMFAWQVPLTDLNKIQVLKDKTGFDALAAASVMNQEGQMKEAPRAARRRREEE